MFRTVITAAKFASYLLNDDASDLSAEEKVSADLFVAALTSCSLRVVRATGPAQHTYLYHQYTGLPTEGVIDVYEVQQI